MATNFKLWLDTSAPAMVSMSLNKHVGNTTSLTLTHSISDLTKDVGQIYMKVWADTVQSPTTASSNIPTSWSKFAGTVSVTGIANENNVSKQYYVHTMYMDAVGNVSDIFTESTGYRYCTKKPTITVGDYTTKVVGDGTTSIKYTVEVFDETTTMTTGVKNTTTNKDLLTSGSKTVGTVTVTKPFEDGLYKPGTNTITITVTDSAGNTTTTTISILYDSQETSGTLYFGTSASDGTARSVYNEKHTNMFLWLDTSSTDIVSFVYTLTNTTTDKQVATGTITMADLTASGSKYYFKTQAIAGLDNGQFKLTATYTDDAGITGELTAGTVFLDNVKPTIAITGGNTNVWYAKGNVYYPTPHTVTFTVADATPSYGLPATLALGTTAFVRSGTANTDVSANYTLTKTATNTYSLTCKETFTEADLANVRKICVYDSAGNISAYTELKMPTWDATAPTITAVLSDDAVTVGSNSHLGSTTSPVKSLKVSDGGSGVKTVSATWTQATTQPTSWTAVSSTSNDYNTSVNALWSDKNLIGTWYLWVKAVDNVGNEKIEKKLTFVYDTVAPTGSIAWAAGSSTNNAQNNVTISATDTPVNAGIKMKVTSSAITESDTDWVPYTTTKTVTFKPTELSGDKTISVQFMDAVGNVSAVYSATITYVSNVAPKITIMDASGKNKQGDYTKLLPFAVRIEASNDDVSVYSRFQLYGDFSTTDDSTASTPSGTWTTFKADSGKNYMTVTGLYFSKNDGVKTVSLLMENTAGYDYDVVTATITLDRTPPTITVTNVSHNIISLKNEDRLDDEHTPNCKCNTVTFEFSANEKLQDYKVCVIDPTGYADTAAASEAAVAIGTTNGSVNMTAAGKEVGADEVIKCTLKGADLKAHPVVNDKDGAYIVGVYGQDVAGVWSLIGSFATD